MRIRVRDASQPNGAGDSGDGQSTSHTAYPAESNVTVGGLRTPAAVSHAVSVRRVADFSVRPGCGPAVCRATGYSDQPYMWVTLSRITSR
jgi:hypothetical protein